MDVLVGWRACSTRSTGSVQSSIVQGVKGAAKRVLSRPVRKKEPLSSAHVRQLVKRLKRGSLIDLRTLAVVVLSYAGFLRYDEVSRIRRDQIYFERTHMKIFIDKSKTDQENVGEWVHIAAL